MDNTLETTVDPDPRLALAREWFNTLGIDHAGDIRPVAGDASFRRYFRLRTDAGSMVLMDAPPQDESLGPFIDVGRRLRLAGLHAPEILHAEESLGFLLLEDLGDELYRDLLNRHNAHTLLPGLFTVLQHLATDVDSNNLPPYDAEFLRTEMDLFPDWYLGRHRQNVPSKPFEQAWDDFCERVTTSALAQPKCFVHRDFHSCNLLRTQSGDVGIIDFQDAMHGPVSYDFISLLWDRYIYWPRRQMETWMEDQRRRLGLQIGPEQWREYCDLMGLQRNFKVVGIFARLYYRDGKQGYIEMIPQFYRYLTDTLRRYPEFSPMSAILENPACVP